MKSFPAYFKSKNSKYVVASRSFLKSCYLENHWVILEASTSGLCTAVKEAGLEKSITCLNHRRSFPVRSGSLSTRAREGKGGGGRVPRNSKCHVPGVIRNPERRA